MNRHIISLLSAFCAFSVFHHSVYARTGVADLELRTDFRIVTKPLTTDAVPVLDPNQTNPHRQRWILSRRVELMGLKAVPLSKGVFGVKARMLQSIGEGYVRGPGPWYRPSSEFGCEKEPNSWFATEEGSREALGVAAVLWADLLKEEKIKLSVILDKISAKTEAAALDQAEMGFRRWLKTVESGWRVQASRKSRKQEWHSYLEEGQSSGVCGKKAKTAKISEPSWTSMMEPFSSNPPTVTQILARAPARLWNGLFTVRLNVTIAGRSLNGRFLVDSGATSSVISPSWLEGQGIYPALLVLPDVPPERVVLGTAWNIEGQSSLAPRARVEKVELSTLDLPIREFLVLETNFFDPPESIGSCCDGVLGRDFLQKHPVEFVSQYPAEVRVWPREGFHWSPETPWAELIELPAGNLFSPCDVMPEKRKTEAKKGKDLILEGITWVTGSEQLLGIHLPWRKQAEKIAPNSWGIRCEGLEFAHSVPASFPTLSESRAQASYLSQVPAVTIGMPLLGRGSFTMDLPHGRIWFSKEGISKGPPKENQSGLEVDFELKKGERTLVVQKILPKSPAQTLSQAGLKPGMIITQLDGNPSEEMDLWEVERRLSGAFGESVSLQWKTKEGLRMAPLSVKSAASEKH